MICIGNNVSCLVNRNIFDNNTISSFNLIVTTLQRGQFRSCSNNQLTFDPATGTGVTDGILDVSVAYSGKTYSDISNEILASMIPSDASYTFIFYQYASTVVGLSGGLGSSPGISTWYSDGLTSILPFTVHEVGHNLGFDHDRYNGEEYGDPTGTMGGGGYCVDGDDDSGKQCFNGRELEHIFSNVICRFSSCHFTHIK